MSYDLELKFRSSDRAVLAAALQQFDPTLEKFVMEQIPELPEGPSIEGLHPFVQRTINRVLSAVMKFGLRDSIELTSHSKPIQIDLFRKSGSISVSYLGNDEAATVAFNQLW